MKLIRNLEKAEAVLEVPGSKSITQRALIIAALARGESELTGPLASEDTKYTARALRSMGVKISDRSKRRWRITGCSGRVLPPRKKIS